MCTNCMYAIKENGGQCPMCRANISSHQVAEDLMRVCENVQEHCTQHEDSVAVEACIDCMLLMCKGCSEAHSTHSTCDIAEARTQMEARISPIAEVKVRNIKKTHRSAKRALKHKLKWTSSSIWELGERLKDTIDYFVKNTLENATSQYAAAKETIGAKEQPTIDHYSPSGWPKELADFAQFGQTLRSKGSGYNIAIPTSFMDVSTLTELNSALVLKMKDFHIDIPNISDTADDQHNTATEVPTRTADATDDNTDDVTDGGDAASDGDRADVIDDDIDEDENIGLNDDSVVNDYDEHFEDTTPDNNTDDQNVNPTAEYNDDSNAPLQDEDEDFINNLSEDENTGAGDNDTNESNYPGMDVEQVDNRSLQATANDIKHSNITSASDENQSTIEDEHTQDDTPTLTSAHNNIVENVSSGANYHANDDNEEVCEEEEYVDHWWGLSDDECELESYDEESESDADEDLE